MAAPVAPILGTTALRKAWSPACSGPWARIKLHGEGAISVRPACAPAFVALNQCLIAWNYLTRQADTGAYVCRRITNGTGFSLHAFGIAADLNWTTNPYGPRLVTDMPRAMVDAILAIRTNSGHQVFGWGGNYRTNKDAMHFEIVCTPAQLGTGINPATVPGHKPAKPAEKPTWKPFGLGETNASVARKGGLDNEVSEAQLLLYVLCLRKRNPKLDPGAGDRKARFDGAWGPKCGAALGEFKRDMIAFQKAFGLEVWANTDPNVGTKTIGGLRWMVEHT